MPESEKTQSAENVTRSVEKTDETYFDIVREQLQFWPYTIHQIDDTLDASLIEARAKQLLFRAIHARNLTAFVGSGLSMSYGRLNWRDWETEQRRNVDALAQAFKELSENSLNLIGFLAKLMNPHLGKSQDKSELEFSKCLLWKEIHPEDSTDIHPLLNQRDKHNVWQWLRGRERAIRAANERISRLHQTFDLTNKGDGHFPGGEEMPVKLEIAQQLHNELRRHTNLFLPEDYADEMPPLCRRFSNVWPGAAFTTRTDAPAAGLEEFYTKLKNNTLKLGKERRKSFQHIVRKYNKTLEVFWRLNQRPEAQLDFEALSKTLLVDECPHAAISLRRGFLKNRDREEIDKEVDQQLIQFEKKLDVFSRDNQKRNIGGIREAEQRYRVLSPFIFHQAFRLMEAAIDNEHTNGSWTSFLRDVKVELEAYLKRSRTAGVERSYLTPSSRYLVPLALSLLDDPFKQMGVKPDGTLLLVELDKKDVSPDDPEHPFGPPSLERFTSRRSILADRFDPMPKIHRDLKIERFITTNYDFEIERYFQDIGYAAFDPMSMDEIVTQDTDQTVSDNAMRRDESGRVLRDSSFSPEHAAKLTSFGLADNGVNVFHLHGRATLEDRLVITERDYMRLYLTDDDYRPTTDEGIKVAFSGAPVLFLGLGMEETDLLRPLRQFISNRDRTIGYTSIALLPADKGLAARTKFSASLYMRYGVHTIFYGSGQITYLTDRNLPKDQVPTYSIDWLFRIIQLCNGLRSELSGWDKDELLNREKEDILEDLIEAVGEIDEDVAVEGKYPKNKSALLVLLNRHWDAAENQKSLIELAEFLSNRKHESKPDPLPDDWDDRANELRTCQFTPTRPNPHRSAHSREAETRISGDKYVGFYTAQLDRLMTMVLNLPDDLAEIQKQELEKREKSNEHYDDPEKRLSAFKKAYHQRVKDHCAPIHITLDGLQGAFITGSLNAALDGIEKEKRAWWKSWQETPHHRLPQFQRLPHGGSVEDFVPFGTTFLRHKLDNVLTPLTKANSQGLEGALLEKDKSPVRLAKANRTHVRAFDTFVAAVACTFAHRHPAEGDPLPLEEEAQRSTEGEESSRRQLITVAARRGMGKGTFMSAFISKLGCETYKKAAWPQNDVFFVGSIHINLGFSSEVASTYDMLAGALIGLIAATETHIWFDNYIQEKGRLPDKVQHQEQQERLRDQLTQKTKRLSREAGIKSLFHDFRDATLDYKTKHFSQMQPRLLLNICAVDLLFDGQGWSKNREINNIVKLLFSDDLRDCPVDFVFLADDAKLGAPWSKKKGESSQQRLFLDRDGLDLFADQQIERALNMSRITMDETTEDRTKRMKQPVPFMALKTEAPDKEKADAFPEKKPKYEPPEPHFIHFTRPVNTAWLLIDNFPVLALALHLRRPPKAEDPSIKPVWKPHSLKVVREKFSEAVRKGRKESDRVMDIEWKKHDLPRMTRIAEIRKTVEDFASKTVREDIADHVRSLQEENPEEKDLRIPDASEKIETQLQMALRYRLYPNVNERDAEEWRSIRRGLGNSRFSLTLLLAAAENVVVHSAEPIDAADEAERLLLDTVARVRSLGQERRDQMVFETVLDTYRRFHEIGHPDLDCDLHLLLIKLLGVIGTPVGSAVLVRLSDIRSYFRRVGIETETSRRRFIVRTLTTMANRGLVFRLDPHPRLVALFKKGDWHADQEFRYALHRVVQSFAMNNLEAGPLEPVAANRFAPTLYSAMPSQGPTLSRKSYQFLRSLIIGLSQYPDIPADDNTAEPWLFTTNDHTVRVQAARAALSLARSNFSVAVVSRLAVQEPIGAGIQRRGHLETYRVRLRWLVRIAYQLSLEELPDGVDPKTNDPAGTHKRVNVLYRDEIVWLYNELGVIALAQGALSDALGYLRQAAEANERVEGLARDAPINNHIDLNHAVVQIERGRFASARRRLTEVKKANSQRKRRLYHISEGYLCVIEHLQGEREGLAKRFKKVTTFLQATSEDRAAALFMMHHARFMAMENADYAAELIGRARNLAETTGHEDVRHHTELTAIRLRLSQRGAPDIGLSDQKLLSQVEDFSRRMSIWSLSVDALWVRASILLAQNENIEAGRLLTRAMGIAKRNSMNLRLNSCITTYASALLQRGDVNGAFETANQSLDLAKRASYALETGRAQIVLRACRLASNDSD